MDVYDENVLIAARVYGPVTVDSLVGLTGFNEITVSGCIGNLYERGFLAKIKGNAYDTTPTGDVRFRSIAKRRKYLKKKAKAKGGL